MNSAVSFDDLKIQYASTLILQNLSLDIEESQFTCFLGPSGCGKSTMLRIIGELAEPASGSVNVLGRHPSLAWKDLGYVFQAPRLVPWRSALGNVLLGLELRGGSGSKGELRERAVAAMETVGISHLAERPAHQLSGGEQQRVAIARALAVRPRILLMDEPFSALDVQTRRQLRDEIVSLWKDTDLTIIFVTHDIDEALVVGSRIVVFSPKPTEILADLPVTLSKPADKRSPEFSEFHDRLSAMLGSALSSDEDAGGSSS